MASAAPWLALRVQSNDQSRQPVLEIVRSNVRMLDGALTTLKCERNVTDSHPERPRVLARRRRSNHPSRAGATARIDGGDMSRKAKTAKPPVTLLTKRAYVDLLRTASAACRSYSAS